MAGQEPQSPELACTSPHHAGPVPPLSPTAECANRLSVPGQGNSWNRRMQVLQSAHPVFLSEPPPRDAERREENKAAGKRGAGLSPQRASPRTRTQLNIPAGTPSWYPHPGPEPHSLTAHPTRSTLSGKHAEWRRRLLQPQNVARRPGCPSGAIPLTSPAPGSPWNLFTEP